MTEIDSGTDTTHRVDFEDRNGDPVAPIALYISIHCPTPARVVRAETAQATPFDTFFEVEVTAAENTITAGRRQESRRITARAVGLLGDQLVTHTDYVVNKAT